MLSTLKYLPVWILAASLGASLWTAGARGRKIELLKMETENMRMEIARLGAEGERLMAANRAVNLAARAQGFIRLADQARRDKVDEIMAVCSPVAEPPKGVIDEETSRRAVALLNSFFMSDGLRGGGPDAAGSSGALPEAAGP